MLSFRASALRPLAAVLIVGAVVLCLAACTPKQVAAVTSTEIKVVGELHAVCTIASAQAPILVPIAAQVAQAANSNGAATVDVIAGIGAAACAGVNGIFTGTTLVQTAAPAPAAALPAASAVKTGA